MNRRRESDPSMTNKLIRPDRPTIAALIPQQRANPSASPDAAHKAQAPQPATGIWHRRLFHRLIDVVAVSLLIAIAVLGAQLSTMPAPPPPGPGSSWIQPVPASAGPGIRPGGKAMTGWLACPPGSLQPFPAVTPLPAPPPPAGCHRP